MRQRVAEFSCRIYYFRYLFASAVAFGADLSTFLLLLQTKVPPVAASVAGYFFGLGIHWLLSSRVVFSQEIGGSASERRRQKALFIGSALLGLATTAFLIDRGLQWGIDPKLTKLLAVGISFQLTYMLRRKTVFPRPDRKATEPLA